MSDKKLQELDSHVSKLITSVRNTLFDVEERLERCNGVRGVINLDDLEEMVDGLTTVLDDLMYLRLGG